MESFGQENRKARPRSWDPTEILKDAHGLQSKVVASVAQKDRGWGGLARTTGSKDVALEQVSVSWRNDNFPSNQSNHIYSSSVPRC